MTADNVQPTSITVRRTIDCTPEEAYDAWVVPEIVHQWNPPAEGATYEFDVRVGGRFRFVFVHEGQEYPHTGEYKVLDRPNKIVHTWKSIATNNQDTLITIEFYSKDGKTEVVLTHTDAPEASLKDHTAGWNMILEMLGTWLDGKQK